MCEMNLKERERLITHLLYAAALTQLRLNQPARAREREREDAVVRGMVKNGLWYAGTNPYTIGSATELQR